MDNNKTYIQVMIESLKKKKLVLEEIVELTKEQEMILRENDVDLERFELIVEKKQKSIDQLTLLDSGFGKLFERVSEEIQLHKELYKNEIVQMQELIETITDLGVILKTLELRNKTKWVQYSARKKEEIRSFKVSNQTVSKYYKNMSDQHQGQSYFLDQKK